MAHDHNGSKVITVALMVTRKRYKACRAYLPCSLKGELRCVFGYTEIMQFSNSIESPAKASVVHLTQTLVNNFN